MATTVPGELNSFHLSRHHHAKHETYHPYFNHHNYGASKHRFSDHSSSPDDRIVSTSHKEAAASILQLTTADKNPSDDPAKKKCSGQYLPSIGDALLRRDHFKESQKTSPCRNEEERSYSEEKRMLKLQNKTSAREMSHAEDRVGSEMAEEDKKELLDVLEDNSSGFPIKSESSNPETMMQQISSRNLSLLPIGVARGLPPEDMGALISMDSSIPGNVENIFRSEPQTNVMNIEPSHSVVSHEAPSYTTLTPLQPLPNVSTVAEKYMLGGGGYPPLMQKETHDPTYNKMGGMGHSLPPLSNRILLNNFASQTRSDMQTQEAIEAVNQVAAAVNLSHYNKAPVLPPNIIHSPPPPPSLTSASSSYESHVLTRLNPHNNMATGFQSSQMFQPRASRGFSPTYTHSLHDFSNSIQLDAGLDKRPRVRQDEYVPVRRKTRASSDRLSASSLTNYNQTSSRSQQIEEVNTKEVADQITAELKRCSIPQAVFARKVLSRSQGTLSDLLRNPKPWSKLKSGRETFRKMWKWLQEPSNHRVHQLRMEEGCQATGGVFVASAAVVHNNLNRTSPIISAQIKRSEEERRGEPSAPPVKKPRLVFTDRQRKILQAIFKEDKRPNKEVQQRLSRELNLEPTTVSNFFMNARRRSLDKWRDDEGLLNSKENGVTSSHHPASPSDHSPFTGHQLSQFTNENNTTYGTSVTDAIIPPLCGPPGGHLHFPTSHHLHSYSLQQPGQQYMGQTSQMLGCNSLSSSSLIHGYQPQAPPIPQTSHLISPR